MGTTVIGAGSWGTALALLLARNGLDVTLRGRDDEVLAALRTHRENLRYLPGFILPKDVVIAHEDDPFPVGEQVFVVVPSAGVHDALPQIVAPKRIVMASKGLVPQGTGILSDLVAEKFPDTPYVHVSGPNLAVELARGIPTATVAASRDLREAEIVRDAMMNRTLRVYVSDDVRGVELAGALKNVMALGAGMSDGLGFGDNTKGTLLARGLNEMARLGLAYGAKLETFLGIAGVGDLYATAASNLSRNYRVGYALGQGQSLAAALESIGQVAEGVPTCEQAVRLARAKELTLPIFEVLLHVIQGEYDPRQAVQALMERTPKQEGGFGN